ncbi:hypothetical protein [uncultured Clostridium sp.]|nr:hypothetical protein [uncultured Clostridium sp.]
MIFMYFLLYTSLKAYLNLISNVPGVSIVVICRNMKKDIEL